MNLLLDVTKVTAKPGYVLELEFENGEYRLFDMSYLMDKKPFKEWGQVLQYSIST